MNEIKPGQYVMYEKNPPAILKEGEMQLRDYFAAKAMQAIIQARTTLPEDSEIGFDFIVHCGVGEEIGLENGNVDPPRPFTWGELLAVESYEIADCMLKVRNNERK